MYRRIMTPIPSGVRYNLLKRIHRAVDVYDVRPSNENSFGVQLTSVSNVSFHRRIAVPVTSNNVTTGKRLLK